MDKFTLPIRKCGKRLKFPNIRDAIVRLRILEIVGILGNNRALNKLLARYIDLPYLCKLVLSTKVKVTNMLLSIERTRLNKHSAKRRLNGTKTNSSKHTNLQEKI